ncbi:ATP-dependent Clp protease proteolytic subunit-related protein 1, chloroplastic-like isoform X2 [Mangifera indica]|uniref:ATP-dependent Clp protease proteolytic subunit-related protein 1, chloroplastic-like isoform X2 n=1 Tax=Mangifera indica TaxID=29780 RepID=UPI001CFA4A0F|nr:ATP-dependent Clp protease proteolytic subunit-related protein 1, chloroplastic-like isoform X2 [Mangifera indica]
MATSLLSPLSSLTKELPSPMTALPKSSFLSNTRVFNFTPSSKAKRRVERCYITPRAESLDHIPKQFREQNLKDGLTDNYKNVPQYLYGLSASQMDMFMTEDNPVRRQSERVTEESISSAQNYLNNGGMWSLSGMNDRGPSKYSMSVSMYRGGARGYGRPRTPPPDLPSLLLDARICYLGMPIVPAVTELLIAQFMWLDFDDATKPIYLYINSSGTQNEKKESVGSETEAYAIADAMAYCKSDVYTVNCGMAYGQAAMLLSLGTKGYRALQPNSSTKLYLPKVSRSSGSVIDMWIKAKELDSNTEYYIELLAKGTGNSKEEIAKDIQRPKYLQAQEAIDYGIADKLISARDTAFEKRDYDKLLAQSKAMRQAAGGVGPQAAPSGFR